MKLERVHIKNLPGQIFDIVFTFWKNQIFASTEAKSLQNCFICLRIIEECLQKNGFWDAKIRFLQNTYKSLQMMWDVFANDLWVQRHLIPVIEPFGIASKKFSKASKCSMRSRFSYICSHVAVKKLIFLDFATHSKRKGSFGIGS